METRIQAIFMSRTPTSKRLLPYLTPNIISNHAAATGLTSTHAPPPSASEQVISTTLISIRYPTESIHVMVLKSLSSRTSLAALARLFTALMTATLSLMIMTSVIVATLLKQAHWLAFLTITLFLALPLSRLLLLALLARLSLSKLLPLMDSSVVSCILWGLYLLD